MERIKRIPQRIARKRSSRRRRWISDVARHLHLCPECRRRIGA